MMFEPASRCTSILKFLGIFCFLTNVFVTTPWFMSKHYHYTFPSPTMISVTWIYLVSNKVGNFVGNGLTKLWPIVNGDLQIELNFMVSEYRNPRSNPFNAESNLWHWNGIGRAMGFVNIGFNDLDDVGLNLHGLFLLHVINIASKLTNASGLMKLIVLVGEWRKCRGALGMSFSGDGFLHC